LGDGARELAGPLGVFCGSGDLGVGEVADWEGLGVVEFPIGGGVIRFALEI
jgi:hypothetical protein